MEQFKHFSLQKTAKFHLEKMQAVYEILNCRIFKIKFYKDI